MGINIIQDAGLSDYRKFYNGATGTIYVSTIGDDETGNGAIANF